MFELGQRLFEYEIVRVLGQGGFATVYEAYDRMLDRQVAIKQLALDKSNNKNYEFYGASNTKIKKSDSNRFIQVNFEHYLKPKLILKVHPQLTKN